MTAVLDLLTDARTADDAEPFSEQGVLRLRHTGAGVRHALARDPAGAVVGYLQVVDDGAAAAGEIVVAPAARRRGVGMALAAWAIERLGPGRRLQVWAHGNSPAAAAMASALDFRPVRVLLQLRRPASGGLPPVHVPEGITIRTFRPGEDDAAWVDVNARAFADHPEQGRLTLADLHERMAEPWFDPAGFFVAVRGAGPALAGFHWTKVHDEPERLGEVYVVGIDPAERGRRLGAALTVTGLAYLVALGVPTLMLYADESNVAAVRMYERLSFQVHTTDVMYER